MGVDKSVTEMLTVYSQYLVKKVEILTYGLF